MKNHVIDLDGGWRVIVAVSNDNHLSVDVTTTDGSNVTLIKPSPYNTDKEWRERFVIEQINKEI